MPSNTVSDLREKTLSPDIDAKLALSLTFTGIASFGLAAVLYGLPIIGPSIIGTAPAYVVSVVLTASVTAAMVKIGVPHFVVFWSILALLQNSFCGLWASPYATFIPFVATEQKTVSLAVAAVLTVPETIRWLKLRRGLLAAVALYFLVVVVQATNVTSATLPYLRNFLVPLTVLLMFAALASRLDLKTRVQTIRTMANLLALTMLTGVVLEIAIGTQVWRAALRSDINGALNSLSDATAIFGYRLPRIGGFMIEPTNAGYIAAATAIVAVVARLQWVRAGNKPYPILGAVVPCLVVLLASGAKSGFLMLGIAVVSGVIFSKARHASTGIMFGWAASLLVVWGYVLAIGVAATPAALWGRPISIVGGDSTTFHLAGLWAGIRGGIQNVIGHGIGVGGNFSRDRSDSWSEWIGTGSESSWGVLAYQAGIIGLLLFCLVLILIARDGGREVGIIVAAWSSSALFAEAITGPLIAGIFMLAGGLLYDQNPRGARPEMRHWVDRKIERKAQL